jgi:spore maturation protein CgeB
VKIAYFVHAVASCWNNGNAHFLRGVGAALQAGGHQVQFCEPENAWSESNLIADHGYGALDGFHRAFPELRRMKYDPENPDIDRLTDGVDLVIVHEWNPPALVNLLGQKRARGARFVLLFHDTHHRALTAPESMKQYKLDAYDGVLAFGGILADLYRRRGWANRAWAWHEAADTSLFFPRTSDAQYGDVVWVGNWGDEERTTELSEYLLQPVSDLGLVTNVFGVRYPASAIDALRGRGISYRGWLANHAVPEVFAGHRATVHVPRRPYAEALRGIPTIRVFEALACGIPLVSAPWEDAETLFPGECFLMARDGSEMRNKLRAVLNDKALAQTLRQNGLDAIRERHSCRHRAHELLAIYHSIKDATFLEQQAEAV